ncbi:MAG: DUF3800 domain-containing protein [Phycisphaerae bacterium]|nr:DUF3800 domain-containing protein [Phycisphaerae bacterium]
MSIINVYCDESCHLEHDWEQAMVLGAVWCMKARAAELNRQIADLKAKHGLSRFFEIKWSKVSSSKLAFYEALVELFFNTPVLHFRGWVIPDKSILRHDEFAQTHDVWYYKMYFNMLKIIIRRGKVYHVYLDIKDTRGQKKLQKLHDVLANANYDFQREIIAKMQHVHSHDIGLLQLADLLIGAVSYHARGLASSPAKCRIVEMIQQHSGFTLDKNTLPSETKFNLCIWQPSEGGIHV